MGAYERVAAEYERTYGEPLVADADWVAPLYATCEASVECDPSFDFDQTRSDAEAEVAHRTAAVIAVMTHGVRFVFRAGGAP